MAQILSILVFVVTLILIFSEKVQRTIVATVGAALMVGVGIIFGFYSEEEAIAAIDYGTLGLLLGMMLLVVLLQQTGFFEYLAIMAGRLSGGNPIRLFILLGTITTVLSMFLDNVTTVVLIAPVTILICELLSINPVPMLIGEALLSDTGGAGTLVGDPPNILIGAAAPFTFNDFLIHSLPVVVVAWLIALFLLLFLFRHDLQPNAGSAEAVKKLDPSKALNDPQSARMILIVLGVAILFFFLHHTLHLSPAFIAMAAAGAALLWVRPDNVSETFEHVEWVVLIFFAALFVMVGGLEAAGVMERLSQLIIQASDAHPILLSVGMIWSVAIMSALVDNIPITIALIPVIRNLGAEGLDVTPLWWALVFGAGFGGNGTIIGSTANIVVVSLSEKTRSPITSAMWNRRGLPVMILACIVASVLLAIFFPWFTGNPR
ncbi:MAG: ArsB/NhaD family transporter [Anaerolineaceae bacterium]|nr:MAG: ArsB/NhaD family transporter [Anaerolineaceae bacterium]